MRSFCAVFNWSLSSLVRSSGAVSSIAAIVSLNDSTCCRIPAYSGSASTKVFTFACIIAASGLASRNCFAVTPMPPSAAATPSSSIASSSPRFIATTSADACWLSSRRPRMLDSASQLFCAVTSENARRIAAGTRTICLATASLAPAFVKPPRNAPAIAASGPAIEAPTKAPFAAPPRVFERAIAVASSAIATESSLSALFAFMRATCSTTRLFTIW